MKKTLLLSMLLGCVLGANAAFGQGFLTLKLDHRMGLKPEQGAARAQPLGRGKTPVWLKLNWNSLDTSRIGKISPIDRVLIEARQKLIDPEQAKPLSSFKNSASAVKNNVKLVKNSYIAVKSQEMTGITPAQPLKSAKMAANAPKTAAGVIAAAATQPAGAPVKTGAAATAGAPAVAGKASYAAPASVSGSDVLSQNNSVPNAKPALRGWLLSLPVMAFALFVVWPVARHHLEEAKRLSAKTAREYPVEIATDNFNDAPVEDDLTVLVLSAADPTPVNSLNLKAADIIAKADIISIEQTAPVEPIESVQPSVPVKASVRKPPAVVLQKPVAAATAKAAAPSLAPSSGLENFLADFDVSRYASMDEFLASRYAITREQIMAWSWGGFASHHAFSIEAANEAA